LFTLAAALTTLPIIAYHFRRLSLELTYRLYPDPEASLLQVYF